MLKIALHIINKHHLSTNIHNVTNTGEPIKTEKKKDIRIFDGHSMSPNTYN